jgi:predicted phosphodiesterase
MKISHEYEVRDLGKIESVVAVCGGIYGNLEALDAFFSYTDSLGLKSDQIIHTGDIVAYCADPVRTTELVIERGIHAIKGNVEESLAQQAGNCGCGFEKGSACDRLSNQWFNYVDCQISPAQRQWMSALPNQLTFRLSGRSFRVLHGSLFQINEFVYQSSPDNLYRSQFETVQEDIIVAGHCGLPYTRMIDNNVWHNSGALGMPANDGTPRIWCSLIIPDGTSVRFKHVALRYDHRNAYRKMIKAGLPGGYAEALISGLWPSLDSLPVKEQCQTGIPLNFGAMSKPVEYEEIISVKSELSVAL